ncbi:MAG: alpha/beta hydrolase [Sphingobium sp.]|uniref:alpha/beta fold hydrolase n=1 Tax=Sphingobium sp. TaxID=1912891 RepID=UPI003BB0CD31
MKRAISWLACLHLSLLASLAEAQDARSTSYDRYLKPGELIEIAPGRRLNLRCEGSGSPTVILEAGHAFPSLSWRDVQPALARITCTCAYDRAGLGFSDPGPMPRSADAIVDDLAALLVKAHLPGPYILVGSSLGGQTVRLFAFRYPARVAGLVLVDPYVEGQFSAFAAIDPSIGEEVEQGLREEATCVDALRKGALTPAQAEKQGCIAGSNPRFSPTLNEMLQRQRMRPAWFEAARSESLMLDTDNEQQIARAKRHLGDMPLIVLSAARNFDDPIYAKHRSALRAEQMRLHGGLAALSRSGEVRLIEADHVIQSDSPNEVIKAVRDMIARSRPGK